MSIATQGPTTLSVEIAGRDITFETGKLAKQADGSVKRVAAPISMYTDIRYEWADPLAQGGKLSASYKVRVK